MIIRLVYKSFVFVVAVCVFLLTAVFGKKLVKERNSKVYYQVVGLSLGLLLDCVAFLIYYAVNKPTAYFSVVLWFTELLPICLVNGMVAERTLRFWVLTHQLTTPAVVGESYDVRYFGIYWGILQLGVVVSTFVVPIVSVAVAKAEGTYSLVFTGFAFLYLLCSISLAIVSRNPPKSKELGDSVESSLEKRERESVRNEVDERIT